MRQPAAGPPRLVGVAHQQRAEDVGAAGDLVVMIRSLRLQAGSRSRAVRGARRSPRRRGNRRNGPWAGRSAWPSSQTVSWSEIVKASPWRTTMPWIGVVGHPGADPGVDAHPRQADLVLRPFGVLVGQRRQLLLVRAPAHFRRGGAFLAEALDAPGVDELVHLLGPVGDLRVALAAMDHLHAQLHGQAVEGLVVGQLADLVGLGADDLACRPAAAAAMSSRPCLVKCEIRPGLAPCSSTAVGPGRPPTGGHPADVHVPAVERPLGGLLAVERRRRGPRPRPRC